MNCTQEYDGARRGATGEAVGLTLVLMLAAGLRVANLSANGFGNVYYAAAARSGLESVHRAFFASYDPAGFVSADKPPVALWIQTLSAKTFGFSGLALHAPQAFAGVLTTLLLWHLVRRAFGATGGLTAALALAASPISVAADRSNLPDSWLVLFLLLSAAGFLRAAETGRLLPLLGGAALAGIAFNVKMLAAFVPLPAFFLAGFAGVRLPPPQAARRFLIAVLIAFSVAASWAAIVDATPPGERPYIGGSQNNTAFGLIFGYNGVSRLMGGAGQFGTGAGGMAPAGAPPGLIAGGDPSPGRLFRAASGEQAMWLFPAALCGLLLGAYNAATAQPCGQPGRTKTPQILLWGGWGILYYGVLSASRGTYHPYYLSALAPALAALVGIAAAEGRDALCSAPSPGAAPPRWPVLALTAALFTTVLLQATWLRSHGDGVGVPLVLLIVGGVAMAGAGMLAAALRPAPRFAGIGFAGGASVLFVAPILWCIGAAERRNSGLFPAARAPSFLVKPDAGSVWREPDERTDEKTIRYLERHSGGARFLCMTLTVRYASAIILRTGRPVMALGGFLGSDRILTTEAFRQRVAAGELRFVLDTAEDGIPGGEINDRTMQLVRDACRAVPREAWRTPGSPLTPFTLYDCGGLPGAEPGVSSAMAEPRPDAAFRK